MKEYCLEYVVKFKCCKKNLETIKELKSLGSSISPIEFCMILDDRLKMFKLVYNDIKDISYLYNREDKIVIKQIISSEKRINKEVLEKIRLEFLKQTNKYFSKNVFHTFKKNSKKYEVFIILI